MISNCLRYCADRMASEKPDILTGLPHFIISGTITGDSIMKQIKLTQGKVALVDDEDFELLNQWKWYANKKCGFCYAVRHFKAISGKRDKKSMLHRQIMNCPEGLEIDHINHNGLDNKKSNLRICTRSQNQPNQKAKKHSSKYKGVSWHKASKKWQAMIVYNNRQIYIGLFDSEIEAAKAYDKKALELFGEFACLNFPMERKSENGKG